MNFDEKCPSCGSTWLDTGEGLLAPYVRCSNCNWFSYVDEVMTAEAAAKSPAGMLR